jgi:septal ring factor EnvC (AmiA/AmiB activator)
MTHAATSSTSIANSEDKLKNIQSHITSLLDRLRSRKDNYQQLQATLKKNAQETAALNTKIALIETKNRDLETHITALNTQIQQQKEAINTIKQHMREDIRQIHRQGPDNQLKIVLNMEDLNALSRTLYYQQKIISARQSQFEKFTQALNELETTQTALAKEQQELALSFEDLANKKKSLDKKQQQRQSTLAKLEQTIHRETSALEKKKQEATQLQSLISKLTQQQSRANANKAINYGNSEFARQRGRLAWPTAGKLIHNYNQQRLGNGQLRWNGVMLSGSKNQAVNAVYNGRIVFAEWLTGFGNLIIIDHDGGYMSLYGHNDRILKAVGSTVTKGEQIATIGNSGGNLEDALYFEIRHNNKPVDPNAWCKK